jgi:hypothetical protein
MGDDVRRHASARVGDAYRDILSGREVPFRGGALVEPFVRGLYDQFAAIRHRVARIDTEVKKRAFQLRCIHSSRPQSARADDFDGDAGTNFAANEILHSADQPVYVCGTRIERLPPREGEQPMGQGGGAIGCVEGGIEKTIDLADAALRDPMLRPVERAGNP